MIRFFSALLFIWCTAFVESFSNETVAGYIESLVVAAQGESVPSGPYSVPIVCAEQASGKIIIFKLKADTGNDWNDPESIVWEWEPAQSTTIKPEHRSWFSHPDECKPVLGTSHLLMNASGGGVALVRLADKEVLFYACPGGNPHSCELLPDGNIVSISSAGYFTVYAVPEKFSGPDVKSARYPSYGGHGLYWDDQQKLLWVLGYTELAAYKYNFDKANPIMTKEFFVPLEGTPAQGGHDLYKVPGKNLLFVTGVGVGVFDLQTHKFTTIRNIRGIKSISMSPEGVMIVLSPTEQWWSESVSVFNKQLTSIGTRTGTRVYKARWWTPR